MPYKCWIDLTAFSRPHSASENSNLTTRLTTGNILHPKNGGEVGKPELMYCFMISLKLRGFQLSAPPTLMGGFPAAVPQIVDSTSRHQISIPEKKNKQLKRDASQVQHLLMCCPGALSIHFSLHLIGQHLVTSHFYFREVQGDDDLQLSILFPRTK